jgi:hypothetical protein
MSISKVNFEGGSIFDFCSRRSMRFLSLATVRTGSINSIHSFIRFVLFRLSIFTVNNYFLLIQHYSIFLIIQEGKILFIFYKSKIILESLLLLHETRKLRGFFPPLFRSCFFLLRRCSTAERFSIFLELSAIFSVL